MLSEKQFVTYLTICVIGLMVVIFAIVTITKCDAKQDTKCEVVK